jgi:putative transposase
MQVINTRYAWDYNRRKKRKGHFWLDRYKSIPVDSDKYALDLMRYINRNPVRAGMVMEPGQWPWSGYRFYAEGEVSDILEPHPSYLGLGSDDENRQASYKSYVGMVLPEEDQRRMDLSDAPYIGSPRFAKGLDLSMGQDLGRNKPFEIQVVESVSDTCMKSVQGQNRRT